MDSKKLFKLCKRKKLKPEEIKLMIDNPDALNGTGENLLHNYLKHDGCDFKLIQDMFDNGHDINNLNKQGYSMFYSCFLYCNANCNNLYQKIDFLMKNFCPLVVPNVDLTRFILYKNPIIRYNYQYTSNHISKYFKLIQKLLSLNLLETNLKDKYPYINLAHWSKDINMLKWFDQNFQMNWDMSSMHHMSPYHGPILHYIANNCNDIEIFEYVCQKCVTDINYNINTTNNYTPLDISLICKNYKYLEILYKYGVNDPLMQQNSDTAVRNFLDHIMQKGIRQCSNSYKDSGYMYKQNFIWLILNHKVKEFPIRYIKAFRIKLNDFKTFPNVLAFNHGFCSGSNNCELFFPEEIVEENRRRAEESKNFLQKTGFKSTRPQVSCPMSVKYMNKLDKEFGLEEYTQEYCQKIYDEILQKFDLSYS